MIVSADDQPLTVISSLTDAAAYDRGHLRIDWVRLRTFADWCRQHPEHVAAAIADAPAPTDTPLDAILAGFAELLAEQAVTTPPTWTDAVPPLADPFTAPGTPAMRARSAASAPEPFRRRNILLPRSAIFRDES